MLSRNIKFDLVTIKFIFSQIHFCIQKHKIIDSNFLTNLKNFLWEKLEDPYKNIKKFKVNFTKKLAYFINLVKKEFLIYSNKSIKSFDINENIFKFLRKKGANYLSQYSLQKLIDQENRQSSFGFSDDYI